MEYSGKEVVRPWSGSLCRVKGLSYPRGFFEGEGVEVKDVCGGCKVEAGEGRRLSLVGVGGKGVARKDGTTGPLFGGLVGRIFGPIPRSGYFEEMSVLPLVFKGRLGIAVLGRGLLLFEFGSSFEAKRVLVRGKRRIKEKLLHLERWSPEVGCFYKGANANEAWVRVVGLPLHLWNCEVFKKLGDGCGGFMVMDGDMNFLFVL